MRSALAFVQFIAAVALATAVIGALAASDCRGLEGDELASCAREKLKSAEAHGSEVEREFLRVNGPFATYLQKTSVGWRLFLQIQCSWREDPERSLCLAQSIEARAQKLAKGDLLTFTRNNTFLECMLQVHGLEGDERRVALSPCLSKLPKVPDEKFAECVAMSTDKVGPIRARYFSECLER